jgi:hypothetical protein
MIYVTISLLNINNGRLKCNIKHSAAAQEMPQWFCMPEKSNSKTFFATF